MTTIYCRFVAAVALIFFPTVILSIEEVKKFILQPLYQLKLIDGYFGNYKQLSTELIHKKLKQAELQGEKLRSLVS